MSQRAPLHADGQHAGVPPGDEPGEGQGPLRGLRPAPLQAAASARGWLQCLLWGCLPPSSKPCSAQHASVLVLGTALDWPWIVCRLVTPICAGAGGCRDHRPSGAGCGLHRTGAQVCLRPPLRLKVCCSEAPRQMSLPLAHGLRAQCPCCCTADTVLRAGTVAGAVCRRCAR